MTCEQLTCTLTVVRSVQTRGESTTAPPCSHHQLFDRMFVLCFHHCPLAWYVVGSFSTGSVSNWNWAILATTDVRPRDLAPPDNAPNARKDPFHLRSDPACPPIRASALMIAVFWTKWWAHSCSLGTLDQHALYSRWDQNTGKKSSP